MFLSRCFAFALVLSLAWGLSPARTARASTRDDAAILVTESEPNDSAAEGTPIEVTPNRVTVVSGAIPVGDVFDHYSIRPAEDVLAWIDVDTGGPQNPGADERDVELTIRRADDGVGVGGGQHNAPANGCDQSREDGEGAAAMGVPLQGGVRYDLELKAFRLAEGRIDPYTMFVLFTTAPGAPEAEPNNAPGAANALSPVAGTGVALRAARIRNLKDVDWYSLEASAGDTLFVGYGGEAEFALELVGPDRESSQVLAEPGNATAGGFCYTIVTPGTYYIEVSPTSTRLVGSYEIAVARFTGGRTDCALQCPADITVDASRFEGSTVYYPQLVSARCGTSTYAPAQGSTLPAGTTHVTATTEAGETCGFDVTVVPGPAPTLTSAAVVQQSGGKPYLVITGSGFTDRVRVLVDGVPFRELFLPSGNTLTATGKLTDGRSIKKAIPVGATVTITVQNENASETSLSFTRE